MQKSPKSASSRAKAARLKGKVGERKTATDLREALPQLAEKIRRGWQTRSGSDEADVLGVPGFWFENKSCRKVQLQAALRQAITACKESDIPVVVAREDRQEPMALLRWSDFLVLLQRYFQTSGDTHEQGRLYRVVLRKRRSGEHG